MTGTVTLTCPDGHVEISVSGSHEAREDLEHVEDALPEEYDKARNRLCPACARLMDVEAEA